MRGWLGVLGAGFALLVAGAACAQDWPGGRKAAIVLTYDDALPSQLDIAVPQLDAAGLRGTFFLNATFAPADGARWRAAAAAGHELGNHSLVHPCPANAFEMEPQYQTERYSVAGMLREIGAMNNLLTALDGRPTHTYGVPCSHTIVGGVDYTDALRASGLVRFVRTGGAGDGVIADPRRIDPFRVPSRGFAESATGADLIAYVEQVRRSGGMGVLMFHGVGGDYQRVSAEAHRELLAYLKVHADTIWVAPFGEVMAAIPPAK
ncbi:MAG: polysaccharide deacetylase [Sphingomonadales bacterium]|nr:MAG: polysaccharide deacetylase [Sphingomonadales bacterium]